MNVLDAAHGIAHDYGVEVMAVRLGTRPKVLNSQVNPNDPTHVLGLVTAVRMQQLADRFDILYAMAESLDHVCIRKPNVAPEEIKAAIASSCVEFGEFIQRVTDSLKDHKVTRNEAKQCQRELAELVDVAPQAVASDLGDFGAELSDLEFAEQAMFPKPIKLRPEAAETLSHRQKLSGEFVDRRFGHGVEAR